MCLAIFAATAGRAESAARPHDAVIPKMVLQTGHAMAVTAAAWTPHSRFVVTGARDRQLILWDTAGRVVDRTQLPMGWARSMQVEKITVDPDGLGALAIVQSEGISWVRLQAYHWRFGQAAEAASDSLARGASLVASGTPLRLPSPDGKLILAHLMRHGCFWSPDGARVSCGDRPAVLSIGPSSVPGAENVALVGQAGLPASTLSLLANVAAPASADPTGRRCDVAAADETSYELAAGVAYEVESPMASNLRSARFWTFSPDGRRAASIEGMALSTDANKGPCRSNQLRFFDFERGAFLDAVILDPAFDRLDWIGPHTLLATSASWAIQAMTIDPQSWRIGWSKSQVCLPVALDGAGTLVSAGSASCGDMHHGARPWCVSLLATSSTAEICARPPLPSPTNGLWLMRPDGACRPLNTSAALPFRQPCALLPGETVAPTGRFSSLAASGDSNLATDGARVWDIASGAPRANFTRELPIDKPGVLADGGRTLLARDVYLLDSKVLNAWDLPTGRQARTFMETEDGGARKSDVNLLAISPDASLVAVQEPETDGRTQSYRVSSGEADGPAINLPPAAAAFGFHPTRPLFWSQARDGAVSFHWRNTGTLLFTFYSLPGRHFFAIDSAGRYDTDLPPDTRDIRWLVPDLPTESLAPQTFMRDYYQPGLMHRLLDCSATDTCAAAFKPVPDLATLNRILPVVVITGVGPGPQPGTAIVEVEASEGFEPWAVNRKTRSGIFDLRLFRDGKLVAQRPGGPEVTGGLSAWRTANTLAPRGAGPVRRTFTVALPTDNGGKPVSFTAYAFNEDRVKGETSAAFSYAPATASAPRPPRAYVIAIGVDAYARLPDHSLSFAVDDARDVAGALAVIPGYEVVSVPLTAERGHASAATKADIRAVLALLAGEEGAYRAQLKAARVDAAGLARATPDDLVILSFSGHGWADAQGNFYLLPSDAARPDAASKRALASLISSAELTNWLRGVDAGEMAMIIDACHSAASVEAGGFRPGPMGDPGLGQLAFDKGIRILAATQADSVAMESAQLHGGLLTYALVHDGLGDSRRAPKALHGPGGDVRLDHLLQYALQAMPALAERTQAGHRNLLLTSTSTPMLVPRTPVAAAAPLQQPSLFDFTGQPSTVTLQPPAAAP